MERSACRLRKGTLVIGDRGRGPEEAPRTRQSTGSRADYSRSRLSLEDEVARRKVERPSRQAGAPARYNPQVRQEDPMSPKAAHLIDDLLTDIDTADERGT